MKNKLYILDFLLHRWKWRRGQENHATKQQALEYPVREHHDQNNYLSYDRAYKEKILHHKRDHHIPASGQA